MSKSKDELYGQLQAAHASCVEAEENATEARQIRAALATSLRTDHKVRQVRLGSEVFALAGTRARGYDVAPPKSGKVLGD